MSQKSALDEFLIRASDVMFPHMKPHLIEVNARAADGDTPLHKAAFWGDCEAIRLLIEAGAEVDARGDMSCTPLYFAVMGLHKNAAEVLIQFGANPNIVSELSFSPLSLAERGGQRYAEMLPTLKDARPNPAFKSPASRAGTRRKRRAP